MEEEFNKAVNEEAERCGTSDYIGIFSGRKLEDIRKALEKLEGLPLKFKTTGRWGRLEKLLRVRQFIKSQFNDSYIVGLITARINVLAREEAHEIVDGRKALQE